ncbi:hypothetical protein K1719_024128 [Acacia pycnantha]|nr:hypothetical protein K1719_024128 [Acacia pycnantha]
MMEEELQRMKEASQSDPSLRLPQRSIHLSSRVAKAHSRRIRQDILSTTIGKPDYPDAVRGETRGIYSFFNLQSLSAVNYAPAHRERVQTIHQSCNFLVASKLMPNDFLLNQQFHIVFGVNERVNERDIVSNVRLVWIMTLLKGYEVL